MVLILKKGASKKEKDIILKKLAKSSTKGVNTLKYCGIIKLKEDPLVIQNQLRDEWQ